jgi:hypothetical protein
VQPRPDARCQTFQPSRAEVGAIESMDRITAGEVGYRIWGPRFKRQLPDSQISNISLTLEVVAVSLVAIVAFGGISPFRFTQK